MKMKNFCLMVSVLAAFLLSNGSTHLLAQDKPEKKKTINNLGVRLGYYTDVGDPFLGFEAHRDLGSLIHFGPNIEYVFSDNVTFITTNIDIHYDFSKIKNRKVFVGTGLALSYFNPKGDVKSTFEAGLNLFLGYGIKLGPLTPFAQAKAILGDNSDFVLNIGLRF